MKNFISHKARTGLLFLIFGLIGQSGWGATIQNVALTARNTPTTDAANWTFTNAAANNAATDYWKMVAASAASVVTSPVMDFSSYSGITITVVTSSFGTITAANQNFLKLEYWDGTIWSQITFGNSTSYVSPISLPYTYASAKIRLTATNASGTAGARLTSILISGNAATPTLTAATLASAISNTYGTASTGVSFTATGTNLTAANITATAQTGFAVSTTSGSGYTTSVSVASGTTVYVQSTTTKAVGTFNGATAVVLSGGGATSSVNITTSASGNAVSAKALTVTASAQTKTAGASSPTTGTLDTHFSVSGLVNSDTANQVTLSYSGSPAGNLGTATPGDYTITPSALTFSSGSSSNYSISYNTGTLTINAATSPTLTAVTLGSALSSTYGTASTGVSFAVGGFNLNSTITATPQPGYEISSTLNGTYQSTAMAGITDGSTLYVRFASTKVAGSYNGDTALVLSGGGASSSANVTTSASSNIVSKATPTISAVPTATTITYGQTLASSTLSGGTASVAGSFAFTSPSTAPNAGTADQSVTFTPTDTTNYNSTTANASVTVNKANQTIAFSALASQTTATVVDYSPAATSATSGTNAITYTSSNTAVATIVSNQIHIVGAGTTTITASQAGDGNYNAATSVLQTLTVTSAPMVLAGWQFGSPASLGSESTYAATTNNSNIGTVTLSRGAGVTATALARAFSATTWDIGASKANAVSNDEYFQFVMSANSGFNFSLSTLNATLRRTATAPNTYIWKYSLNGTDFTEIGSDISFTSTADGVAQSQISLSNISDLQNAKSITFRLYAWGGITNNTGTFAIARYAAGITTNCLAIGGNTFADLTPPTLTADASSNTVDNNIDITFTDDTSWRSAITAVKIGSTALTLTTDYVISSGNIQLKPSGLNVLLTASGSKSVSVVATGYSDATVTQVINPGAPTDNSTATISSILAPNVTRTVTCTAKDQYSNLVSGYAFKYDATIVSTDATTAESYTIDSSAITSSTNNVSLTSTTNSSGVATFTVVMPAVLDANDGLSLQVQLADGSTNIGSAFAYHELPGQTITFGSLSAVTYGDAAFSLSATGGASGNPVIFTSSNPLVATCTGTNGTTLTITGAGTVTIYANQSASASYNAAAQESQSLVVNQKGLTISGLTGVSRVYNGTIAATFTGTPAYVGLAYGQSFLVSGTASAVFSDADVGTGKTITISGYTVPSANYTLTQPTLTADITQASQTISFGTLPNRVVGGASFTLPLNASSTLAISYASSDTNVATVSGNTVTIIGVGTTTITASQAGNSNYAAATNVTQSLTILAVPIAGWDFFGQNNIASLSATTLNSNLTSNGITRGVGATANSAANSFSTAGFQNNGISTANTDYFQITLAPNSGYKASFTAINANFDGTTSFYASPGVSSQYAYSLDGTNFTLIGSTVISTSLKPDGVDLTGISALQNVLAGTTITIRYYASGQTTSGGWRFYSPSTGVLGLAIGGSVDLIPTNNWTGAISTSWNDAGNWSLSRVPLSTDNITISTGSPVLDVSHTIDAGRTLTLTSAGPFTINPNKILTIAGTADFGGKSVIVKSDNIGDGAIGQVTGTLSNATNVTVERYILEGNRAWRLLTAPLVGNGSSNTTIFNNWQNNGSVATGAGVELWGPGGTGAVGSIDSTTGLAYGPGGSIKQYGTGWSEIINTKTTDLFTTTANKAFGVFVTGHFGSGNISNGAATATTLRPTGQLIAGDVSFPISNTIHTLIGNPYASPISPSLILANTDNAAVLFPYLWVWDPKLNDFGGYVLYDNGFATYSGGSYSSGTAIQSGQAFFVRTEAVTGNVLKLKESMKSGSVTNTFRNSNSIAASIFRASFLKQTTTDWMPLDGCIAGFYEGANAAADDADGKKMINTGENIGFVRNAINLSSEHYPLVTTQDILSLKIWNTQQAHYKLKLNTEEFTMLGVEAYLQDLYTGTTQPLNLDGSVQDYEFDVDPTVSASSGNRFRIVFTNTALAVTNPEQGQLSIYPNPATGGKVTVSLPTGTFEGCSYELINVLGQVVRQDEIANANSSQVSIPLTGLPNSWYALRIRKDNKVVYQGKLIINN